MNVLGFFLSLLLHGSVLVFLFITSIPKRVPPDNLPAIELDVVDAQAIQSIFEKKADRPLPPVEKSVEKKPTPLPVPVKKKVAKKPQKKVVKKESKPKKADKKAPPKKKSIDDILKSDKRVSDKKPGKETKKGQKKGRVQENNNQALQAKKLMLVQSIQAQLMSCWNMGSEKVREAYGAVVTVALRIDKAGYILSARTLKDKSTLKHPAFSDVERSVHRVFDNPACRPLQLPQDLYAEWQETNVRFCPGD